MSTINEDYQQLLLDTQNLINPDLDDENQNDEELDNELNQVFDELELEEAELGEVELDDLEQDYEDDENMIVYENEDEEVIDESNEKDDKLSMFQNDFLLNLERYKVSSDVYVRELTALFRNQEITKDVYYNQLNILEEFKLECMKQERSISLNEEGTKLYNKMIEERNKIKSDLQNNLIDLDEFNSKYRDTIIEEKRIFNKFEFTIKRRPKIDKLANMDLMSKLEELVKQENALVMKEASSRNIKITRKKPPSKEGLDLTDPKIKAKYEKEYNEYNNELQYVIDRFIPGYIMKKLNPTRYSEFEWELKIPEVSNKEYMIIEERKKLISDFEFQKYKNEGNQEKLELLKFNYITSLENKKIPVFKLEKEFNLDIQLQRLTALYSIDLPQLKDFINYSSLKNVENVTNTSYTLNNFVYNINLDNIDFHPILFVDNLLFTQIKKAGDTDHIRYIYTLHKTSETGKKEIIVYTEFNQYLNDLKDVLEFNKSKLIETSELTLDNLNDRIPYLKAQKIPVFKLEKEYDLDIQLQSLAALYSIDLPQLKDFINYSSVYNIRDATNNYSIINDILYNLDLNNIDFHPILFVDNLLFTQIKKAGDTDLIRYIYKLHKTSETGVKKIIVYTDFDQYLNDLKDVLKSNNTPIKEVSDLTLNNLNYKIQQIIEYLKNGTYLQVLNVESKDDYIKFREDGVMKLTNFLVDYNELYNQFSKPLEENVFNKSFEGNILNKDKYEYYIEKIIFVFTQYPDLLLDYTNGTINENTILLFQVPKKIKDDFTMDPNFKNLTPEEKFNLLINWKPEDDYYNRYSKYYPEDGYQESFVKKLQEDNIILDDLEIIKVFQQKFELDQWEKFKLEILALNENDKPAYHNLHSWKFRKLNKLRNTLPSMRIYQVSTVEERINYRNELYISIKNCGFDKPIMVSFFIEKIVFEKSETDKEYTDNIKNAITNYYDICLILQNVNNDFFEYILIITEYFMNNKTIDQEKIIDIKNAIIENNFETLKELLTVKEVTIYNKVLIDIQNRRRNKRIRNVLIFISTLLHKLTKDNIQKLIKEHDTYIKPYVSDTLPPHTFNYIVVNNKYIIGGFYPSFIGANNEQNYKREDLIELADIFNIKIDENNSDLDMYYKIYNTISDLNQNKKILLNTDISYTGNYTAPNVNNMYPKYFYYRPDPEDTSTGKVYLVNKDVFERNSGVPFDYEKYNIPVYNEKVNELSKNKTIIVVDTDTRYPDDYTDDYTMPKFKNINTPKYFYYRPDVGYTSPGKAYPVNKDVFERNYGVPFDYENNIPVYSEKVKELSENKIIILDGPAIFKKGIELFATSIYYINVEYTNELGKKIFCKEGVLESKIKRTYEDIDYDSLNQIKNEDPAFESIGSAFSDAFKLDIFESVKKDSKQVVNKQKFLRKKFNEVSLNEIWDWDTEDKNIKEKWSTYLSDTQKQAKNQIERYNLRMPEILKLLNDLAIDLNNYKNHLLEKSKMMNLRLFDSDVTEYHPLTIIPELVIKNLIGDFKKENKEVPEGYSVLLFNMFNIKNEPMISKIDRELLKEKIDRTKVDLQKKYTTVIKKVPISVYITNNDLYYLNNPPKSFYWYVRNQKYSFSQLDGNKIDISVILNKMNTISYQKIIPTGKLEIGNKEFPLVTKKDIDDAMCLLAFSTWEENNEFLKIHKKINAEKEAIMFCIEQNIDLNKVIKNDTLFKYTDALEYYETKTVKVVNIEDKVTKDLINAINLEDENKIKECLKIIDKLDNYDNINLMNKAYDTLKIIDNRNEDTEKKLQLIQQQLKQKKDELGSSSTEEKKKTMTQTLNTYSSNVSTSSNKKANMLLRRD